MRIQHNIMAMNAYRNYNTNTKALAGNLEKLSSGYKINRAGDDAAGLAISEKMRAQITGLDAAQKNVKDGISLVKTAEGAMQEIQDMLNRMDYLATQSANGTYQDEVDRENLQKEVDALKSEINRIADSANFNGIKLLDGSLSAESVAKKIEVGGAATSLKSAGAKGEWEATFELDENDMVSNAFDEDCTLEYTVALDNDKSYTASLKLQKKDDGSGNYELVAKDGKTTYTYDGTSNATGMSSIYTALHQELNRSGLQNDFAITDVGNGKYNFTALQEGTKNPQVIAIDAQVRDSNGDVIVDGSSPDDVPESGLNGVKVNNWARDEGREIKAADLIEYNGTNYDDAVFTINGKKFVLMTDDFDADDGNDGHSYMRAVEALGPDVTVLVGGRGGLMSGTVAADGTVTPTPDGTAPTPTDPDTANSNFKQNIAKIAEVTGLKVTDAFTGETPDNGINAGQGIRLSIGTGTSDKSLTLQIGDTADDYNQMKVSVGDMHTEALGIDSIDISNQSGAQAAIQTIKDAINQVSSVRGDLGAIQNRLEHTGNNLSVMAENIQDAESTIRDTDVADEMMKYVKNNILVQSAQAMLAQANQVPQGVLQLLG